MKSQVQLWWFGPLSLHHPIGPSCIDSSSLEARENANKNSHHQISTAVEDVVRLRHDGDFLPHSNTLLTLQPLNQYTHSIFVTESSCDPQTCARIYNAYQIYSPEPVLHSLPNYAPS